MVRAYDLAPKTVRARRDHGEPTGNEVPGLMRRFSTRSPSGWCTYARGRHATK